jgi:hypothetical protein
VLVLSPLCIFLSCYLKRLIALMTLRELKAVRRRMTGLSQTKPKPAVMELVRMEARQPGGWGD